MADGTLVEEHSHELLDTELAREELQAIVGGQVREENLWWGNEGQGHIGSFYELQILGEGKANPYDGYAGHYGRNPKANNGGTIY